MLEQREKCQILTEFLDQKVFDPVLEALPEQYSSEIDRKRLVEVQKDILLEKEKFHNPCLSPEQIKESYVRGMYFETNSKLGKELEDLELPRFVELRESFLQLCEELKL
ncbi:MAG TPA: hypothetical protein PLE24_07740 [Chitinispirillaceae bacterium]|nr:hypothetical protein [Chitinispirillaceae bacterium]